MMAVYGIDVETYGDPYVKAAEDVMEAIGEMVKPGTEFFEVFPMCE